MAAYTIREACRADTALIYSLIKGLAEYERRPQDVTGSEQELEHWLFDRGIATTLIIEYQGQPAGYALYYPVFGSFSARGKIHLEDIYIRKKFRGKGLGTQLLAYTAKDALSKGYSGMEWGCLHWNEPSIQFYKKLGAEQETSHIYFEFSKQHMQQLDAEQEPTEQKE